MWLEGPVLAELPPDLYIITLEIPDSAPVLPIADSSLPVNWRIPENILLKEMGDAILTEKKYLGIKARSAVMQGSFNYILNPIYPNYHAMVKVVSVQLLEVDQRLKSAQPKP